MSDKGQFHFCSLIGITCIHCSKYMPIETFLAHPCSCENSVMYMAPQPWQLCSTEKCDTSCLHECIYSTQYLLHYKSTHMSLLLLLFSSVYTAASEPTIFSVVILPVVDSVTGMTLHNSRCINFITVWHDVGPALTYSSHLNKSQA